jgi:hypothetical protein
MSDGDTKANDIVCGAFYLVLPASRVPAVWLAINVRGEKMWAVPGHADPWPFNEADIIRKIDTNDKYLVWSHEHSAWWRPAWGGYTPNVAHAGRYSYEEAIQICQQAAQGWSGQGPFNEVPVAEADINKFANRWG